MLPPQFSGFPQEKRFLNAPSLCPLIRAPGAIGASGNPLSAPLLWQGSLYHCTGACPQRCAETERGRVCQLRASLAGPLATQLTELHPPLQVSLYQQ